MTQLIYGIASESYLSIRLLLVLAEETTDQNLPLSLATYIYVDDLLKSSNDFQAAEDFAGRIH